MDEAAKQKALRDAGITHEWLGNIRREAVKGYIYIIRCNEFYKIGCSRDGADKRLKAMQTGNPYELELIFQCEVTDFMQAEAALHAYFKDNRVRGEWYRLTAEQVNNMKQVALND